MTKETEELVEKLLAEVFSGQFAMGGATVSADGKCESWGGERIMRLRNPDGPAAAARITSDTARIAELEAEKVELIEKVAFWIRNSERNREQASRNHDSYLRLWAEHGGPELPERLRTQETINAG